MDFDRFTRSMLLAQGGFSAFLQAAPDDRAPILEQITGTEIYSQISIRVHERRREEQEALNLLQVETAGIVILEPEEEQRIGQLLETKQKEETDLAASKVASEKAISWINTIDGLKKEISDLADESSKLQKDIEEFKPDREKLSQALSAAKLDGAYATLTATRRQQTDDRTALETGKETLPGLESSAKEQAAALQSAEQRTAQAREELKAAVPTLNKVRSLDQKLADQKKATEDKACKRDAAKIEADKGNLLKEQERRESRLMRLLSSDDHYLEVYAQDEWLVENLGGIEEQFNNLITMQNETVQNAAAQETANTTLELAAKSLEDCQKQSGIRKQELEDASKQLQQGKDGLSQLLGDRLLREYRTEKETLLREMAFLTKIAELEDHRAKLEDGKPCPLCGATEHPFAEGNVPVPDETERKIDSLASLISKAEDQEAAIKKLEDAERLARTNLTDGEKLESAAANDKKAAEKALAEVKDGLVKLRADFAERRQAVATKLQPLGIADISETDISSLIETLTARLKAWQAQVKKKADIEKQIADIDSEVKRLDAVIETQSTALAEKLERLETLKKELATGSNERNALYGDKSPDDEERRFNKAISDAEGSEKQVRDRHNELQQKWNTAKSHVESLKKRIDLREPELRRLETEFSAALAPVGFSNEEQFLAAILPTEARAELTATAKDLDERQTDLKARQKDRETRLAKEVASKITDKSLEELEPQFKKQEEALKELRDIIAGLKHKLSENAAAKERIKEKQAAIETQKKECRRWENLHELIGSADGKKYRNFAQGLTFEMMIGHANRQLQRMSDRYLLIRDDAQPWSLTWLTITRLGSFEPRRTFRAVRASLSVCPLRWV